METKLLTDRQFRAWNALRHIHMKLLPHLSQRLAAHSGLTGSEFVVLVSLYESDSPAVRAKDLCRDLDWEPSRLSHQVKRMEVGGLVKREKCPSDARGFQISLTAAGKQVVQRALPLQDLEVKRCFGDVLTTQQLDCLIEIAESISKHLQDEHPQ